MPYCTLEEIRSKRLSDEVLIQLTDDAGVGEIDQNKTGQAIDDAGELIDGYLRKRYSLPLDNVKGLVVKLALDISTYNLYGLRPEVETPDRIASDYKAALKLLEQIQRGDVKIGVDEATGEETTEALQVSGPTRIFDSDTLDGY